MILNVIDRRKHFHRWRFVDAVIYSTWHDNCCEDADLAPRENENSWIGYDARFKISLAEAINWAREHPDSVTLHLYDVGGNKSAER